MKDNNKETSCEQTSSLTQVSTTYARICVILLALNFCVTGYVMRGVLKLQQEATVGATAPAEISKVEAVVSPPPAVPSATVEAETLEKN